MSLVIEWPEPKKRLWWWRPWSGAECWDELAQRPWLTDASSLDFDSSQGGVGSACRPALGLHLLARSSRVEAALAHLEGHGGLMTGKYDPATVQAAGAHRRRTRQPIRTRAHATARRGGRQTSRSLCLLHACT